MPLQASGQISFTNVATEIAVANSNLSMRSMSSDTGGTIPDAMSDFYGKSVTAPTWTVSEISTFTSNQSINAAYDMIAFYARLDYASTLPITERGYCLFNHNLNTNYRKWDTNSFSKQWWISKF